METKFDVQSVKENLDRFTGTENYYQHPFGLKYTDGVKYIADSVGAHWLLDLIVSWQPEVKKKLREIGDRDFQAWTLSKTEDGYRASCTNGNGVDLVHQDLEFTTFPEDLMPFDHIWVIDGVAILKSEY